MGRAKDIILKVITAKVANNFVKKNHYSGKVVPNSRLHFGCFLDGKLGGVMSYGPSINKKGTMNLVKGTGWNGFIELNRMAFSEMLPKYSESRCISVSIKLLKKYAPQVKWIISFADATQCGDGTIYRASSFKLIGIKKNSSLWEKNNIISQDMQLYHKMINPRKEGWKKLNGYQLRYIYFIDKTKVNDLTVPVIPFSKIKEMGIGMYKGIKQ
jgi:hypothetical protein